MAAAGERECWLLGAGFAGGTQCLIYSPQRVRRGPTVLLAVALAAIALLTTGTSAGAEHRAGPAEDAFTFGDPAFCAPKKPVEDFGLSELPPVHEVPEEGDLPFGPKTVSLLLASGPVLPPGESVGFWLNSENYGGHTPLHWVLRNRIRPVDTSGQAGQVVARGHTRVRTINAAREVKLFLHPPRNPGFYRYDVEIVDFDGKFLAQYSRYVRVERKFWDARLGLNDNQFQPGGQVLSRVENFGTEAIAFGEEFRIQAYRGGNWVHVRDPSRDGWLLWLGFASPGLAGRCSALRLPRDFPAGQYRIVKEVGPPSWPNGKRSYHLAAPFEVVN
jgi:hypothetical protein